MAANSNFFMVGNEFADQWLKKLGAHTYAVYTVLRRFTNKVAVVTGKTYRLLHDKTGIPFSKISEAIKDLCRHNLIEKRRGPGRSPEYVVVLHPDAVVPPPEPTPVDEPLFDLMEATVTAASAPTGGALCAPTVGAQTESIHICVQDTATRPCCCDPETPITNTQADHDTARREAELLAAGVRPSAAKMIASSCDGRLVDAALRHTKSNNNNPRRKKLGGGAVFEMITLDQEKYGLVKWHDGRWLTEYEASEERKQDAQRNREREICERNKREASQGIIRHLIAKFAEVTHV